MFHLEITYKQQSTSKDLKLLKDLGLISKVPQSKYEQLTSLILSLYSRPALQNYALDFIMHQCFGSAAHGQCKKELSVAVGLAGAVGTGVPKENLIAWGLH